MWIPRAEIEMRARQMAAAIAKRFSGEPVRLIAVLNGAVPFHELLVRMLRAQPHGPSAIQTDTLRVKSYQGDQAGSLVWGAYPQLTPDLHAHVVMVEDIVDTGRTLVAVTEYMSNLGFASVSTAVLLDKQDARKVPFKPDWTAFCIPELFVIGFGLDYDEQYRELPDIYGRFPADMQGLPKYDRPDFTSS